MPETKSGDKKTSFTISLSPQAIEMVEDLIKLGIYGTNRGEVVRALVNHRLEDLIGKGVLKPPVPRS
jgi:Arc/MetJ-type ribon-helix-helix transcriptional regulator